MVLVGPSPGVFRMRRLSRSALAASALAAVACTPVAPPPAGAEAALHWLYQHAGDADDASLVRALENFDAELGARIAPTFDAPLSDPLLAAEIADTGLPHDPSTTFGIIAATELPCPLGKVEPLHVALDQNELHGGYDAYQRVYSTSADEYHARRTNLLEWDTEYTLTVVGGLTYTARIKGEIRSVAADPAKFPAGRVLVGRAFLKEPAVFANEGSDYFRQDYQLDLYYERAGGKTVHVFAAWREMRMGIFSPEQTAEFMRGGSKDADQRVAARCAE